MQDFKLTRGQDLALQMVRKLVMSPLDRPYVGVLRGYAGTGKTTMLRVLAQEIGQMFIMAPTGKAALRVTEATGLSAGTIHRFIYEPYEDPLSGEVKFRLKDSAKMSQPESCLLVIEEASMIGVDIWNDIYETARRLQCHILCVGDPFQLPPVENAKEGDEPFGVLLPNFKFDFEANLTEITRQALESPIIRASMMLRQGDAVEAFLQLPRISPKNMLEAHEQVLAEDGVMICHRNTSRQELNTRIRAHRNLSDKTIHDGEPLLVLRNNYDLHRFNGEVLKFEQWIRSPGKQWEIYDRWKQTVDHSPLGLASVDGDECVLAVRAVFGKLGSVGIGAIDQVARSAYGTDKSYLHCNFGYTLTAHKSQGSEWKSVIVVVERSVQPYTRDGARWAYTAVTRAREKVGVVWLAGRDDEQIT